MSHHALQPRARSVFWGGWSAGDSGGVGAAGASQEGVSPSSWKTGGAVRKVEVSVSVRAASLELSEEDGHACLAGAQLPAAAILR